MAYVKASAVLPKELLAEVQRYVQGETVYIPKTSNTRKEWGSCSGTRVIIDQRNELIKQAFQSGASIDQLADKYFLSCETIKKIIYRK